MVETGAITPAQAEAAKAEPIKLAPAEVDASEAPYFVDLVHDQITQRIGDYDTSHSSLRIYTSLDPDLQLAASAAVEAGMKRVDALVAAQHKHGANPTEMPAGRLGCPQPAHRPGPRPRGRAELLRLATRPRHVQAPHRLHLQALGLRHGGRAGGRRPEPRRPTLHRAYHPARRPHHLHLRRPDLQPRQLPERVPRRRPGHLRPRPFAQQRDHLARPAGRLRQRRSPWPRLRYRRRQRHAFRLAGRLRRHAPRHGRGLYRLRQRRRSPHALAALQRPQHQRRRRCRLHARRQAGDEPYAPLTSPRTCSKA